MLTPDFIPHAWLPLVEARLVDHFVELRWSDGTRFKAYELWLYENVPGSGFDVGVREGLIDPTTLPKPGMLKNATVDEEGALLLRWVSASSEPVKVHPGWLHYVAQDQLSPAFNIPSQTQWSAETFSAPPTLSGADILQDEGVQKSWLRLLAEFGLCRLKDTPADEMFLQQLIETVGPIRASNFGGMFRVQTIPNPDSTANTGLQLGQHTDLPTRETPPGFQFLHCVQNTVAGGHSRMTDGMAVVQALQAEQPRAYDVLTTAPWYFMNRSDEAEHRWCGPIIELPQAGRPLTLRAFYPVRSAPAMPSSQIPAAYAALRVFSEYAHDPRFQIVYPFQPGDLIGFDNRRVLHGRDAFDSQGERFLMGCYIDHDEIYSRLRVLSR